MTGVGLFPFISKETEAQEDQGALLSHHYKATALRNNPFSVTLNRNSGCPWSEKRMTSSGAGGLALRASCWTSLTCTAGPVRQEVPFPVFPHQLSTLLGLLYFLPNLCLSFFVSKLSYMKFMFFSSFHDIQLIFNFFPQNTILPCLHILQLPLNISHDFLEYILLCVCFLV